ncbi:MAG: hypothetical protein ACRDJC_12025 [Thermomicrobiales bacterium]
MQERETADTRAGSEGAIRLQLQQQHGGRTIHHASQVLRADGGVAVEQLEVALRKLHGSDAIPGREQAGADAALAKAIRWVAARPPAGVFGRFSKSFYFDPLNPRESWRFDVEGLSGSNLRR